MSSEYYGYRNGHSVGSGVQYRPKARKGKGAGGEQGLSNGLIILVIAIVVGCFAVLWPKYFYPMLFGESLHQPRTDPEAMFMSGAHGREYLQHKLKERGGAGGHPGLHPGTGEGGQARARMTPPIRTADVSHTLTSLSSSSSLSLSGPDTWNQTWDGRCRSSNTAGKRPGSHRVPHASLHCGHHHPLRLHRHEGISVYGSNDGQLSLTVIAADV